MELCFNVRTFFRTVYPFRSFLIPLGRTCTPSIAFRFSPLYNVDRTGNDDIADCHGAASAGIASRYVATRQSPKINGPLPENCEKIAAIAELF